MTRLVWGPWARRIVVFPGCCLLFLAVAASVSPGDVLAQAPREVTVGVPRLFPPYYQLDEDGNPSGFAVDVMNEVARQAGFEITYRVAETGGDNFKAIRAGDIDIIPSLGINDYRKQYVAFTRPVDTFRIVLFVRADTQGVTGIDDMVGRPVAVVVDNVGYRFLENRTDIQLKVFPTFTEALFALLSAKVDGFVYPEPVTLKLVREAGVSEQIKAAAKPLLETKRSMAVRKDNTELLAALDQAIGEFIASPEYQRIYVAWFGKPVPFWTLWRVVLAAGILSGILLIIMAWWRYRSVVRLNRALQEAEERFRAVVTYSPTKIHIKDAAGRYTLINPLAEKLFGVTDEEGRGKTTYDLFEEDVAAAYTAHDQTVMESGQAMEEEEEFILEDGVHTFLTTKFPIRGGFGKAIAIGAIGTDITERKRTEEALRESEERFRGIFEQGAVGIAVMSPDGHFAQVNQAYCDFIGYRAEDLTGRYFDRVIHPDDRSRAIAHWDAVMTGAAVAPADERRYLHKSGDVLWGLAGLTVLRNPEGAVTGYLVQVQDITERKQAEEALHTREAQLRGIMDNAPIQIVLKDTKGRYVLTNPQWQKSYSLTEEEAQGKTIRDLFPEEFANALSAHELEVVKTGKTIIHEDQLPQADGVHDFITVKFPIRDVTGELVNFGAMSVDITERKRAEENLQNSEARLRTIIDTAVDGVIMIDTAGTVQMYNQTCVRLFGYKPDEVLGQNVEMLMPSSYRVEHNTSLKNYLQTGKKSVIGSSREVVGLRKDGSSVPLDLSLGETKQNGERVFVGILRDITDRKRAEREILELNEDLERRVEERTTELRAAQDTLIRNERLSTLGQLTATVSHELRNPLGVIRTSAFIVQDGLHQETPRIQRALERIERNVIRCDRIIDELLDFTRISEIEAEPTPIDAWLEETLNEQTLPSGVALRSEFGMPDMAVPFDRDRLRRAIINVFDNGCQAMIGEGREDTGPEEHTLTVRTQEHDGRAEVIFEDTGPGIPPDVYERIFEPLYSTKGFGVGLGLPVVKQIMEQHGGGIEIETEEGRGTRVVLWLPTSPAAR